MRSIVPLFLASISIRMHLVRMKPQEEEEEDEEEEEEDNDDAVELVEEE